MLLTIITTPLYDDKRKRKMIKVFQILITSQYLIQYLTQNPLNSLFFLLFFGTRHKISFLGKRVILILQFFIHKTYKLICQILNTKQQEVIKILFNILFIDTDIIY